MYECIKLTKRRKYCCYDFKRVHTPGLCQLFFIFLFIYFDVGVSTENTYQHELNYIIAKEINSINHTKITHRSYLMKSLSFFSSI